MTSEYLINLAKTEFREGYNGGDAERVLSAFASGFSNFAAGQPSFWGQEARQAMRARTSLSGQDAPRFAQFRHDAR